MERNPPKKFVCDAILTGYSATPSFLANGFHLINRRVMLTWGPSCLQPGPHTGRGAKPVGLGQRQNQTTLARTVGFALSRLLPADKTH